MESEFHERKEIMNNKKGKVFLVRIAGITLDELDFYSMFKTLEYRKKYKQKELELQLLENELTEKLYLFIQQISDQDIKKVCINIKRDIHNRRTRKVKKYELLQLLPSEIGSLINEWIDMQNNMQLEKEKLNIIFKNEIRCIRKKIKSFCTVNNEFIEGLLVANFDLYNRMLEYTKQEEITSRKLKNTEISLTNYISRMAYKPSPFASFAGVSYGSTGTMNHYNDNFILKESIRCNISLLKYIENKILQTEEGFINSYFSINSTLISQNGKAYLINRNIECLELTREFENINVFDMGIVVEHIVSLYSKKTIYTYKEICCSFFEKWNTSKPNVLKIIKQLVDVGLLQNYLVTPNQDYYYLNRLYKVTKCMQSKVARECHSIFRELLEIQNKNSLSLKQMIKIREITDRVWNVFSIEGMQKYTPVFEDMAFQNVDLTIEEKAILNNNNTFSEIKLFMSVFDDSILQKIALQLIYEEEKGEYISIFDFYKKYCQEDKLELWRKIKSTNLYHNIHQLRQEIYDYLFQLIESGQKEEVSIDQSWMKNLIDRIPKELLNESQYSMYVQPIHENDKVSFIINKMGPGMYRHFSRYLNLFQDYNMGGLKRYIEKQYQEFEKKNSVILMDINAIFGLNINVHTNVLKSEFTYPRSCPNVGVRQIRLNDIVVHRNLNDNLIGLYEKKSDKRIEIVPLGFLFSMIAPQMYSFLSLFSRANGVEYSFWSKVICEQKGKTNISILPRLSYKNIIIDRKTWCVKAGEFNNIDSMEDFFTNLDVLRHRGINNEVFVKASSVLDSFEEEYVVSDFEKWMTEVKNTKLRKPQYINFKSFFHQKAFIKIISQCEHNVMLQEVLPNINNTFCKGRRIMEFLIE